MVKKFAEFKQQLRDEQGQTLIIIFVLMVLSLTVGIAISSKYIKNISSIERADESTRAIAIAESLIEHLLIVPIATLEGYAVNHNCGTACHLEITSGEGQILSADAELTILGNSTDPYFLELKTDEFNQVNLNGYPSGKNIYVCWNNPEMAITGLYVSGTTGNYIADAYSYNAAGSTHMENKFAFASAMNGYESCFTVTAVDNSVMLRLKAVYSEQTAVIIPDTSTSLPTQGILIKSTGSAGVSRKVVSIIITDPIVPPQFDYVLFQKSTTQPLSN